MTDLVGDGACWSTGATSSGRARTQTINRLHRLLLELFPGGAKRFLSAPQARALIATIKPRDIVGKTRRRLAVELVSRARGASTRRSRPRRRTSTALVTERGSTLMELHRHRTLRRGPAAGRRRRHPPVPPTRTGSRPGTAPHPWTPPPATSNVTGCPGPGTGGSTGPCTSWPSSSCATPPRAGPTTTPGRPPGRPSMEGHARPQTPPLQRRVRPHARRPEPARQADGPGRALGATTLSIQRDRLTTPDTGSSDKPLPGPATSQPRTLLPAVS